MAAVGTNSAELRAIKKNRSKLVTAIAKQGGLTWFSQKLQEFDFITSELVSGITGKMGVSDEDKVSSLLEAVESKIKLNQRGTPFSDFVEILESEGCLQDMGQALRHMIKEQASRSRMSEAKPSLSTQDSSADSTGGVTTLLQQLQAQIEQLRVTVRPEENVRSCPICNTELPAHLHQQDIESHVKAHFQDLAEISEQRPKLAEENTHKVQQRQLQHNSRSGTVEEALVQGSCEPSGVQEERVKELEEQVEQMGQNCEAAVRELSSHAEESKHGSQQVQVEELLTRQAQMQQEFTELRDRYDEQNKALELQEMVLDEKVSELKACQQQKLALEEQLPRLAEDNTKLEHKVEQLRAQIEQLKAAARSDKNVRSCPICNTIFPSRMHQQDFKRHVQGHFQERQN